MNNEIKIAVVGLGYVGLPLARLFATKYPVVGFDINGERVKELKKGHDSTLEVEDDKLQAVLVQSINQMHKQPILEMAGVVEDRHPEPALPADGLVSWSNETEDDYYSPLGGGREGAGLFITRDLGDISECNYYIITVPTPIDKNNRPDLTPLYKSSESVAKVLKKGDTVIYESTVYPGVTEEECVPVLEEVSGLKFNEDFFVGYSPERINPGDKEHTVEKILKVTSGSLQKLGKR